ncbi:MAG: helix-turn-helix domain-containing protein [Chitinispirillaceae bacterium]|jgi:transcriptional regulator with XRE-family HTH domain
MEHDDSAHSLLEAGDVPSGKDKCIGEMLRREREKRQITVEMIAAKLRLNAKYIEALEENRYDRLPGDTYIRVYLRSLARYLSLDSEEIFRRFFDERGLSGADTLRKDSKTKINLPALDNRKRNDSTVFIAIFLIIVLAGVGFLGRKHGWRFSHLSKSQVTAADSTNRNPMSSTKAISTNRNTTSSAETIADNAKGASGIDAAGSGPMKLLVSVQRDSCLVRAYSDGKEWRRVMHRGGWKAFFAQDSFNVCVSASDAIAMTLNDQPVSLQEMTGASALKVARTGGTARWTLEKWDTTFH